MNLFSIIAAHPDQHFRQGSSVGTTGSVGPVQKPEYVGNILDIDLPIVIQRIELFGNKGDRLRACTAKGNIHRTGNQGNLAGLIFPPGHQKTGSQDADPQIIHSDDEGPASVPVYIKQGFSRHTHIAFFAELQREEHTGIGIHMYFGPIGEQHPRPVSEGNDQHTGSLYSAGGDVLVTVYPDAAGSAGDLHLRGFGTDGQSLPKHGNGIRRLRPGIQPGFRGRRLDPFSSAHRQEKHQGKHGNGKRRTDRRPNGETEGAPARNPLQDDTQGLIGIERRTMLGSPFLIDFLELRLGGLVRFQGFKKLTLLRWTGLAVQIMKE